MAGGVHLGLLLNAAGVSPQARYVVFHCADNLSGKPTKGGEQSPGQYYESIGLKDAFHPQTLIAYALNGSALDVPLRLRLATSKLSTSRAFRSQTASQISQVVMGATGRTVATNGTRGSRASCISSGASQFHFSPLSHNLLISMDQAHQSNS